MLDNLDKIEQLHEKKLLNLLKEKYKNWVELYLSKELNLYLKSFLKVSIKDRWLVRILRNTEWRNNAKSVQNFLENFKRRG